MEKTEIIEFCKKYGKEIGQRARDTNCEISKNIILYYDMFYKCQENGSLALLEIHILEYQEKYHKD